MGVAFETRAAESLVYVAPTTPRPMSMTRSSAPRSFSSRCMATVPLAPMTFVISKRPVRSSSSITWAAARPVRS